MSSVVFEHSADAAGRSLWGPARNVLARRSCSRNALTSSRFGRSPAVIHPRTRPIESVRNRPNGRPLFWSSWTASANNRVTARPGRALEFGVK